MSKKAIKKMVSLNDRTMDYLASIKDKHGHISDSETVRYALTFTYNKENPAYVEALRETARDRAKSPEEKAVEHVDKVEARRIAKEQKEADALKERVENGRRIAGELRGVVVLDEKSGDEKCKYYSYGWLNPKNAWFNERVKYLDELTDDDIEFQYYNDGTNPKSPMPADQVIATLVELGLTDNMGKPL